MARKKNPSTEPIDVPLYEYDLDFEPLMKLFFNQAAKRKKALKQSEHGPQGKGPVVDNGDQLSQLEPDDAIFNLTEIIKDHLRGRRTGISVVCPKPRTASPGRAPLPAWSDLRKAHHLAVDLFYKTYAADIRGVGRPPLSLERCWSLFRKKYIEKKSYLQIAIEEGANPKTAVEKHQAAEKIRQQVRIAFKRIIWRPVPYSRRTRKQPPEHRFLFQRIYATGFFPLWF
jgi:hypothetical protein